MILQRLERPAYVVKMLVKHKGLAPRQGVAVGGSDDYEPR